MTKKYTHHVSSREDSTVHVTYVKDGADVEKEIAFWNNRWAQLGYGQTVKTQQVDEKNIPKDNYFKMAWRLQDKKIVVDLDAARKVHMENIRAARNEKLKFLDIKTLRGHDVQTEKQHLRDLPQTFDLTGAKTPEELKELWPQELL